MWYILWWVVDTPLIVSRIVVISGFVLYYYLKMSSIREIPTVYVCGPLLYTTLEFRVRRPRRTATHPYPFRRRRRRRARPQYIKIEILCHIIMSGIYVPIRDDNRHRGWVQSRKFNIVGPLLLHTARMLRIYTRIVRKVVDTNTVTFQSACHVFNKRLERV